MKKNQTYESHEDQIYKDFIRKFRENNIPERYNQVLLLDDLNDKETDHYISISTRADGKSFNYTHALLTIAIEYDLGITFLSRNMMLRTSYQTLIDEVIDKSEHLNRADFNFVRQQYYTMLNYKDRTVAVISDLNNATELKYFSNFLKKFPIIVYDEFLALENDYLSDEWERLFTIYSSIDRGDYYPLIHKPKIFYLGNAVNFSSPVLAGLKIFKILENHPMGSVKKYKYDFNIQLELHRNDSQNEVRNTRAFGSINDPMTTAEFKTNPHHIATENDRLLVKKNPRLFYVKLKSDYLKIWFNRDTFTTILAVESAIPDEYLYNLQLKDNLSTSTFLNERYFSETHIKKIDRGAYLFDNNYSKNYITNDFGGLQQLKINKLMREFLKKEDQQSEKNFKEKQFELNYIEQSKRGIMKKMWG